MTCVHKVRWSVKRPENCRFRLSVSHYKDRIVAPDEYSGETVVTPSDETQVLPTRDKTVRSDITINPAPTETLATSENGTFLPSSGNVGFSSVTVDVEPALESLSVTENGLYLPDTGVDGFDRVSVDVPIPTFQTEEKTINANGVYYPSAGKDGVSKVTVDVPVGLVLIDTVEVNGVNGVQVDIDATWFDDFDFVIMVPDLTFSALDWPYIVQDATTGGSYAERMASLGGGQCVLLNVVNDVLWAVWFKDASNRPQAYTPQEYLYWYLYGSNNTMTGAIKVYGIKVTS